MRILESKIKLGTSKRASKRKNGGKSPCIHAGSTARTYMGIVSRYGLWLRAHEMNYCTLEAAKANAAEYILMQHSVYTQYTVRSALAKVFDCSGPELCNLPPRNAADITKGRTLTTRAAAVERNRPELAEACRSMGLRKSRELMLVTTDNFIEINGKLFVHVKGKGGRIRNAMVLDGPGRKCIEELLKEQPAGKLFRVPNGANVHRWRADYAARCYRYAMENGMGTGIFYRPRDGSGRVYDKGALDWVSEQLGHGPDRYYTVVYNYLSYGDADR